MSYPKCPNLFVKETSQLSRKEVGCLEEGVLAEVHLKKLEKGYIEGAKLLLIDLFHFENKLSCLILSGQLYEKYDEHIL